ncbi:MAG TPA: carbonic anhydrase [Acetobacteraceae bacterium]|jgi:carbonic anhydrase|nr:carbonic anhydrase [Acetobacteraceae bacterium]
MCKLCIGLSRRGVLAGLSAALIAAAPAPPATITGEEALHRLMQGNARYRSNHTDVRDFAAGRAARVTTHTPIASILSCSDARVGPEFLFGQGPGDLFVVRVAGNILQDEGLASLEYAAQFLGSPLIFVLGHSNCGAVEAAIKVVKDNAALPGHLPGLIDQIKPAVLAAQATQPANLLNAAIAENVRLTTQAVVTAQPVVAALVAAGKVKVAGGVYDIATGAVSLV